MDAVIEFASKELARYLGSRIGLDFSVSPDDFDVEDPTLDDAYHVKLDGTRGFIKGSNSRSVLLGLYRLLEELGFYFPVPGRDIIPDEPCIHALDIKEAAAYRHRGICIEGATGMEHVLLIVDWLAKNGMNTYFTQFFTPYEFIKLWCCHDDNSILHDETAAPSYDEVEAFIKNDLAEAMAERGLIWHGAGHGFTSEAFGYRGRGWEKLEDDSSLDTSIMAELDHQRGLFGGVPLNTNLCLSQEKARSAFVDAVTKYSQDHPGVDVIHVWLADAQNNSCECEACSARTPSDWYVILLNEIDKAMSAKGLKARIVLLSYFDLLWPPVEELDNPSRFIYMWAPITRSYKTGLTAYDERPLPPFVLNKLSFPKDVSDNLAFAREWKRWMPLDSFCFDYHYMWNHFRDLADYYGALRLYEDIARLKALGFNGFVSCQVNRAFGPAGLGMHALAKALWGQDSADFDSLASAHFTKLFGRQGGAIRSHLERISRLAYLERWEDDGPGADKREAEGFAEAADECDKTLSMIGTMDDNQSTSDLGYMLTIVRSYCQLMAARRRGEEEEVCHDFQALKDFASRGEMDHQWALDVHWLARDRGKVF